LIELKIMSCDNTSKRIIGIGNCSSDNLLTCCPKTCCELSAELQIAADFDLECPAEETVVKNQEFWNQESGDKAKGKTCGCLNKASDTEVKGYPGDCQKDMVKGLIEDKLMTCKSTDTRKIGVGDCSSDNLLTCCPKTCCELSTELAGTELEFEFDIKKCPAETVVNGVPQSPQVIEEVVTSNYVKKEEVRVFQAPRPNLNEIVDATTEAPTLGMEDATTEAPTKRMEDMEDSSLAADEVCKTVQEELAKMENKIKNARKKELARMENMIKNGKEEKVKTWKKQPRFAKKVGDYSQENCATAVVFEKDGENEMVRINFGAVIQVTGNELLDGKETSSKAFTVTFGMPLKSSETKKPYKNGCTWVPKVTETGDEGTCKYVAS